MTIVIGKIYLRGEYDSGKIKASSDGKKVPKVPNVLSKIEIRFELDPSKIKARFNGHRVPKL